MKLTVKELLELALDAQIETSYSSRPAVVGLSDVEAGYRPLYPVTVYQLSGDDTSGIAGLLYPSGEFRVTPAPRTVADYWEFDETLRYERVPGELTPEGTPRVVGNSWTTGEVVWDGVAGDITPEVEMTAEVNVKVQQRATGTVLVTKSIRQKVKPHVRANDRNSFTGEWMTTGELWRALERGTQMLSGPVIGRIHLAHLGGAGNRRDAMGDAGQ